MKKGMPGKTARCIVAATLAAGLVPAAAYAEDATTPTVDSSGIEETAPGTTEETPPEEDSENLAEGTWGSASWIIDNAGALAVGAGTGTSTNGTSPWSEYADIITSVSFEGTVAPANCAGLFADLSSTTSINLEGLDTRATTNMGAMFSGCSALSTLDLADIDTARVTSFASMFSGCGTLSSLDLSGFSTARATTMSDMFEGCSALSQVTVGRGFSFKGAGSTVLAELPSTFNGRSDWYSTNEGMWLYAEEIASSHNNVFTQYRKNEAEPLVDPSAPVEPDDPAQEVVSGTYGTCAWDINESGTLTISSGTLPASADQPEAPWAPYASNVKSVCFEGKVTAPQNLAGLFKGLLNVEDIDLAGLDTSKTTSMASLFSGCRALQAIDLSPLDASKVTDMSGMFNGCAELTSVDLSCLKESRPTNLSDMFRGCSSLESVNFQGFDTSRATSFANMFYGCAMLKTFDLASLDMSSNVTLSRMFAFCTSLENVSFNGADTSHVTRMDSMFNGCSSLAGIDFANVDTSRVTRMDYLFNGCSSLATVNAAALNTRSVATMENMFNGCTSLLTLDLTALDTSKVANMANMFNGCTSLYSLALDFNTAHVTTMSSMFSTCQYLTELDLSSFSTDVVTDMHDMFSHCTYLQHLDISGFNTSRVSNMKNLFEGCTMLSSVNVGSGFSFAGASSEPQCKLPAVSWSWGTSEWYSTADGTWLSADTISRSGGGKATIYQKGTTTPTVKAFPVSGEQLTFTDVNYMDWYGPAVSYVSSRGIIKGYDDTALFGVEDTMTRAQFAVILCRLYGADAEFTPGNYPANTTGLTDVEDHAWYTGAANWAVENGIISGVDHGDGTKSFNPNDPLEFQQMVVIVARCAGATLPADTTALDRFEDGVFVASYAQSAMAWAVEEGLVSGYSGIELRPAEAVSRVRGATIVTNCCLLGYLA